MNTEIQETVQNKPDRMAETQKGELDLEEFEIKEETVSIKEEILPSSIVEDTCSVDTNMKGKLKIN